MDEKPEAEAPAVDLLGDPWTEARDPRGRKRHKRTAQVAEKVAVLRAAGHTAEEIASRVGLSEPTLRKYYFRELDKGPNLAKAVLLERLWKQSDKGNVSATKALLAEFEKGKPAIPVPKAHPAKEEQLGKKAAAALDARTAHVGTTWGDALQ